MTEQLGRFGHHPDPATDFIVEVETLEGIAFDRKIGIATQDEIAGFDDRCERAMSFRVGGDLGAIQAKRDLRALIGLPSY